MVPSISTSSQVCAQPSSEMRRGSRINLTRVLSSFVKFCSNVFFSAMVTDIFMIFNISGDGSMSRFSVSRKFKNSNRYLSLSYFTTLITSLIVLDQILKNAIHYLSLSYFTTFFVSFSLKLSRVDLPLYVHCTHMAQARVCWLLGLLG